MTQLESARKGIVPPEMVRVPFRRIMSSLGNSDSNARVSLSMLAMVTLALPGCASHSQLCRMAKIDELHKFCDKELLRSALEKSIPIDSQYSMVAERILSTGPKVVPPSTEITMPRALWTAEFDYDRIRLQSDVVFLRKFFDGDFWTVDFYFKEGKLAKLDVSWGGNASL